MNFFAAQWFLHSWTSSKMSQFFPFEERCVEEKLFYDEKKTEKKTDQHLNLFEKNPRFKVPETAKFKEYPSPNLFLRKLFSFL